MKRFLTGFSIAIIIFLISGTPALAYVGQRDNSEAPHAVNVDTDGSPVVSFEGPGDNVPPPQITIETPQGVKEPTF